MLHYILKADAVRYTEAIARLVRRYEHNQNKWPKLSKYGAWVYDNAYKKTGVAL